jgi:hypothetical protein
MFTFYYIRIKGNILTIYTFGFHTHYDKYINNVLLPLMSVNILNLVGLLLDVFDS